MARGRKRKSNNENLADTSAEITDDSDSGNLPRSRVTVTRQPVANLNESDNKTKKKKSKRNHQAFDDQAAMATQFSDENINDEVTPVPIQVQINQSVGDGIDIDVNEDEVNQLIDEYGSYDEDSDEGSKDNNSEVILGATAASGKYKEKKRNRDDKIRKLVNDLLEEKLKSLPRSEATDKNKTPTKGVEGMNVNSNRMVKSPSDTTLYTPALQK